MGLGLIRIETFLWIRSINPNESGQSELSIRMIPKNSVLFGLIGFLITSDCPDSCGLILINSDGPDTFGLQGRINFEWASDWFELKHFFGLDRSIRINSNFQSKWIWSIRMIPKNSVSFGLILNGPRIDSNWKITFEFQSETFARELFQDC